MAQKLLEAYGVCDAVSNGKEGIERYMKSRMDTKPYDVIFLDIMMPEMNGQETLRKIREWEKKENINGSDAVKVIMLTALDDKNNIMEAFRSQCEGYMVKPIDRKKIIAQLQSLDLLR